MMQLLGTPLVLGTSLAGSEEGVHFYFKAGYSF
jgi:hypothetical protein